MSRVVPPAGEPVDLAERAAMTPARKARIWNARKGKCWFCGQPVPESGPDVRYDHKLPLDLGGTDDDENIWPIHREPCDRIKTAADAQRIAKHRRQSKLRLDQPRTTSIAWRGKSRGFSPSPRIPAKSNRP